MSHIAIFKWIKKYVALMRKYLEQIKPNVGNAWRTDELFVKIKGDMKYLYALMDDETTFWIAQQVADTKYTANINPLFHKGKQVTGKRPNTLISDGARNFIQIQRRELGISDIFVYRETTTITGWRGLTVRSETEKK